jgi:hypothetical protein
MSENFSLSTQFEIGSITIDGNDVIGLFNSISIYENINSPLVTGTIVLLETDKNQFVTKYDIEGSEDIEFEFTNANGQQLQFKGVLNGLTNKTVQDWKTTYAFNFSSKSSRDNEKNFIVKRFNNEDPQSIIEEMIEKMGGQTDNVQSTGKPMSFTAGRRRPADVIKYVMTHGVATKGSPSASSGEKRKGETKGTTGFLCWETLSGYRFASVDDVVSGQAGEELGTFTHRFQNKSLSMQESMESVIQYDFDQIGDIQTKLRSGAFTNKHISFNMDTGQYTEYDYKDDKNMTDKQKEIAGEFPTRVVWKPFTNEVFENSCQKAQENYWDQSREYLSQNIVRQNTFTDQHGTFTLPPRYEAKAGDTIEIKIPRVQSEDGGGYNEKHSGRYVIKQVGHHMFADGSSYTKLKTVRSTIQQDDATSRQS